VGEGPSANHTGQWPRCESADLHEPDRLVCQAADFLDDGPGFFPVPVFVDVFHKDIIATEGQIKNTGKLEYWNDGILEEPILYPPFHYSLFHSFFFFNLRALCDLCGESFFSVDEIGDHRLAQGEAAVVAGHLAVDQDFEPASSSLSFIRSRRKRFWKTPPLRATFSGPPSSRTFRHKATPISTRVL